MRDRRSRNIDIDAGSSGTVNGAAAVAVAARELTERLRYEQARRREQMLQSLLVAGGGHSTLEPSAVAGVIVGVEVEPAESTIEAHAVLDLRGLTPWLGMSSCGVPAEYLTLVPDLAWAEVDGRLRCPHCDSAALPGA